jgi:hypothetical protein
MKRTWHIFFDEVLMDTIAKKVWEKPQLVILVRSQPEEAVLACCKTSFLPTGPSDMNAGCYQDAGCSTGCSGVISS